MCFQRFERNEAGRDYVVGDIHGCFDQLEVALRQVDFDEGRDRLFSVGDLVDRGPRSEDAIDWIAKPWFHAVRGNHEQMAIGVAEGRHDLGLYLANGGGWFLALDESRQQLVAKVLDTLPVCIEVETMRGTVGIVHAEIEGHDWRAFVNALENAPSNNKRRDLLEQALWARDRIRCGDRTPIDNLFRLYVGHTPVKNETVLGNVHYVDTGAVFGRHLTLLCISDANELRSAA
jgi:serine/threonine protein phosphatase 1